MDTSTAYAAGLIVVVCSLAHCVREASAEITQAPQVQYHVQVPPGAAAACVQRLTGGMDAGCVARWLGGAEQVEKNLRLVKPHDRAEVEAVCQASYSDPYDVASCVLLPPAYPDRDVSHLGACLTRWVGHGFGAVKNCMR
jgi:hypothetical protein